MSDPSAVFPRRILVALDASAYSLAALKAAVTLAAELEAEVVGLFVEDVNLLNMAGLPFTREIQLTSARDSHLTPQRMALSLRLRAARAQAAFQTAVAQAALQGSFSVIRGEVAQALLEAAAEADLLILGRVSQPLSRQRRLGSTAHTAAIHAPHSVMLMPCEQLLEGKPDHIAVVYDGSELSAAALQTAANLTAAVTTVIIVAQSAEATERLQTQAQRLFERQDTAVSFHISNTLTVDDLIQIIDMSGCDFLVLGGQPELLSADNTQQLLEQTDCTLMIVRP